jgi:hypothetical protein
MLTVCDAAFIDEELTVRWHHAGTATEAFGGTAALDQMWVLYDLIRSRDLDMPLRVHALRLWCKALARSPKTVLATARGQRVARAKSFAAHTRHLCARNTLPFEWDTHYA